MKIEVLHFFLIFFHSFFILFIKHYVLNDFQFFLIFIFKSTRELHTIFLLFPCFSHPFIFPICCGQIIKVQGYLLYRYMSYKQNNSK